MERLLPNEQAVLYFTSIRWFSLARLLHVNASHASILSDAISTQKRTKDLFQDSKTLNAVSPSVFSAGLVVCCLFFISK